VADISAIADAIATRVRTITALTNRTSAFGKDFADPPWAIVVPSPGDFITFDSSMARGSDDLTFIIKVVVLAGDDRASQDALTTYLDTSGSGSIKAAVDGTLGGVVSFATVTAARNYGEVQWAGVQYNGCEFVVEVSL
jgi:hypothetical protein